MTDSTIRRDLACLSSLFTIAADWELCDANPVLPFLRAKKKSLGYRLSALGEWRTVGGDTVDYLATEQPYDPDDIDSLLDD